MSGYIFVYLPEISHLTLALNLYRTRFVATTEQQTRVRVCLTRQKKNKNRLRIAGLYGAGDEVRTRDILLGKEAFYH